MNLDYLRSFSVIVECNSISQAAKKLHLTQPGLSLQLQGLENEIGAKLLIRSNKGVELTEEGRIVYEHASSMLSLENNIHKSISKLNQKDNILSISACKSLGEYVLPCSIYTFREIYMDLDVSLDVYNSNLVIEKLLNHETNIAIITGNYDYPGIISIPILKDELILVSSADMEYTNASINDIKRIPLVLRDINSNTRIILKDALKKHSIDIEDLNIILSANSPESIKSTISSGRGFAFLPEITVRKELRAGTMKKVDIKDLNTKFHYHLLYRENSQFTKQEERFKIFITSNKRCFCT